MFAQDAATTQPPRPWRLHLLMALNSWTIFSERSLDAKLAFLLLTQKTIAVQKQTWFGNAVLSLPPPVWNYQHGSKKMIVISMMQALFGLSLCVAIIQMNTPEHYCRCVAIVWTFFVPCTFLNIWWIELIKNVKWWKQHHVTKFLHTFVGSVAHKFKLGMTSFALGLTWIEKIATCAIWMSLPPPFHMYATWFNETFWVQRHVISQTHKQQAQVWCIGQ